MTNAQIQSFMAVVQYQSFSRAAEHLFISQSAVSKNVAQLERDLGYVLIDRTYGSVRTTEVGRRFYEFFCDSEHRFDALREEVRMLTSGHAGDLRLGCLDGWDLSEFYPELQRMFREHFPGIRLRLDGYNHMRILDALAENEIDIAITLGITLPRQDKLVRREIAKASAVLLFSAMHPLAGREDLRLEDFRDEPFYVIAPSAQSTNPMETLTLRLCRAAGFEPRIERISSSVSILMCLQSGTGVQLTCQWTSAGRLPLYRMLPLDHQLSICAAWLDDDAQPAKHIFVNELLHLPMKDK